MVARREARAIGVQELERQTREVLRRVQQDGEVINVADGDTIVARIVPARPTIDREALRKWWDEVDKLAEEIDAYWPEGVSAAEAVAEARREL
jgi:antitoxin (DNA-binding transcriptional repressor) of toxin-antitoxin stability system